MNNQSGQLTLEFMLALILIISVSTILGILTFTLTLTEVLQYVTFAGARSYMAADVDPKVQADNGDQKVHVLMMTIPFLTGAAASGWIKVPKNQRGSDDYRGTYAQQLGVNPLHSQFIGYQLRFTVPMLNVQIPFIKDVVSPPEGMQDFGATLSSFLMREPSFNECQDFMNNSFPVIMQSYSVKGLQTPTVILDNGC